MNIISYAFNIETYGAGANQATHPSVLCFDKPWNGFKYYMAYTPYPYGQGAMENPSLCASNDLVNWNTPEGLINPIASADEHYTDELKDTHLVFNCDLDQIEIWYLGRYRTSLANNGTLCVYRKISKDGVNWSPFEEVFRYNDFKMVSPSVLYYAHAYHFWGIRNDEEEIALYYMNSNNALKWSVLQKCEVPDAVKTGMWHGCVYKSNADKYYFVWMGHKSILNAKNSNEQNIMISESLDGHTFSDAKILVKNKNWDYFYRPCFFIIDQIYYCIYGVVRSDGAWYISQSHGTDLKEMKELEYSNGYIKSITRGSVFRTIKNSVLINNKLTVFITFIASVLLHFFSNSIIASSLTCLLFLLLNINCICSRARFVKYLLQGLLIDIITVYIFSFISQLFL